jgi:uncharacterized protein (TIGR02391 family)
MPKLIELVRDIEQLLTLSHPQLAHIILRVLLPPIPELVMKEVVSGNHPINLHPQQIDTNAYAPRHREAELALLEAWAWMESQAILVRTDRHGSYGFNTLSMTGASFFQNADSRSLIAARRINQQDLHAALHKEALAAFWQRSFDTSVFAAMKAVEVSVREASGLGQNDIGTGLMRKAFDKDSGPLTDQALPTGERESLAHLFHGAIGVFKNPSGHRYVSFDADTCADVLVFASRLLHMVDKSRGA